MPEKRNPAKRRRVSNGPMLKHADFTSWAEQQGVEINSVCAEQLPGRGVGLATTKAVKNGERLLFVPEETMFKPDTGLLAKYDGEFSNHLQQRASSQARLAVSALFTFTKDSSYQAWMDSWPTREDVAASMPLCWDQYLIDMLPKATRLTYERQWSDYSKDWLVCQHAVLRNAYTEADFKYFWLIVNSRSFHWAPPKGKPGHMVMCPFIDYMNHGPTGSGVTVIQRSDGYEVIANRDYSKCAPSFLLLSLYLSDSIVTLSCEQLLQDPSVRPPLMYCSESGEEIVASYGSHTNDKLLVHYGFCLQSDATSPSTDDDCRIDDQVMSVLSDTIQERLSYVGYLAPFALVPIKDSNSDVCRWEPCFKTQVAIRATFQTCNEWEFFAENGEDLSADVSEEVNKKLAKALQSLFEEAAKHVKAGIPRSHAEDSVMSKHARQAAAHLVMSRWEQILSIVSRFSSVWEPIEQDDLLQAGKRF